MAFTPLEAHLNVALVLSGKFGQFADPLDWVARQYGLDVKVDRQLLAESLARPGGGVASSQRARAEAPGSDKQFHFEMELFGRCEGKMVALCGFRFKPSRLTLKTIEDCSLDMLVLHESLVLGVQATLGKTPESLDGLSCENPVVRLLPLNIFNYAFFGSKIEQIEGDRKLKLLEAGNAAVVQLAKPWLFYDVPQRRGRRAQKLLPFQP